jgi:hypothetical protein
VGFALLDGTPNIDHRSLYPQTFLRKEALHEGRMHGEESGRTTHAHDELVLGAAWHCPHSHHEHQTHHAYPEALHD